MKPLPSRQILAIIGLSLTIWQLTPQLFASERTVWLEKMQPISPERYVCRKTPAPITIDGKLDEAGWRAAEWTSDFADIEGGAKPKPRFRTRAKLLWDDKFLYIAAELEEPHVWATLTNHDSVIFHDPDFEVFIDPLGQTQPYYEFEINALNTTWDLRLDKPYLDDGKANDAWEITGAKSAVQVEGTLNQPSDIDKGWTVEMAFPWAAFAEGTRSANPPREADQWRISFSRVEWQIAITNRGYQKIPKTPEANWVWSPQGVIDMHRPEMWGIVQFTSQPASESISVTPIPGKASRDLALEIYHAQRDFSKIQKRWATNLSELNWTATPSRSDIKSPELKATTDGYTCTVGFTESGRPRVWQINQDRLLILNAP